MTHQYLHVVFARERYWQVVIQDQTFRTRGNDANSALTEVYQSHFRESEQEQAEAAAKAWDEKRSEVAASIVRSHRREKGYDKVKREMTDLRFPSGRVATIARGASEHRAIDEETAALHGLRPNPESLARSNWNKREANATEVRGWTATLYEPEGHERALDADLSNWRHGAPLVGITATLNKLGAAGWKVIATSEDKGLYQGADAADEAFPARLRYLMGADAGAAMPDL